jgi:hypothetical protein
LNALALGGIYLSELLLIVLRVLRLMFNTRWCALSFGGRALLMDTLAGGHLPVVCLMFGE